MESISCLQWDIMYPTWMPSDAIRSWDTMMQFCNYIQNGHATLSVFGLQHWVFLLCNKQPFVSSVTATALIADTAPDLVSGEPAGFEASEESVRIPSYNGGNGHFPYMFTPFSEKCC